MTTITSAKNIVARSVFLLSAVLGGWTASAILSAPITAVEHAMMRGCPDNSCHEITLDVYDPNTDTIETIRTGKEVCDYESESDKKCEVDASGACEARKCCAWWQIFGCSG